MNLVRKTYGRLALMKGDLSIALVLSEGTTSPKSSAFIRLLSPLSRVPNKHIRPKIILMDERKAGLSNIKGVCIVQRTAISSPLEANKLIRNLKNNNTTLVVDTDDAFGEIDKTHPEFHTQINRVSALDLIIRAADQVWVSTNSLAKFYRNANTDVRVIPNSLDKQVWENADNRVLSANSKVPIEIVYMGTATHDADFDMIFPALDKVATKFPGSFRLTVIGVSKDLPEREWIERVRQPRGGAIYPNFVKWFTGLGPFDVGLAPLVDNNFNRGKSDIKCLDYLAAKILPVVSDVEAYNNKELDDYIIRVENTQKQWEKALTQIVSNPQDFRKSKDGKIKAGNNYIWSKRSSEETGVKLFRYIKEARNKN